MSICNRKVAELLKEYQLTPTQYNMLRILRGAGKDGLTCSQACERIDHSGPGCYATPGSYGSSEPNRTRTQQKQYRRVVITKITPDGLDFV